MEFDTGKKEMLHHKSNHLYFVIYYRYYYDLHPEKTFNRVSFIFKVEILHFIYEQRMCLLSVKSYEFGFDDEFPIIAEKLNLNA